jgi:hypothetical protein
MRWTTVAAVLAVAGCASSGGGKTLADYAELPSVGLGDCAIRVINTHTSTMEVFYHTGLRAPGGSPELWPRIGYLEPRQPVIVKAPCEDDFFRVHATYERTIKGGSRAMTAGGERRLLPDRVDTLRLTGRDL